LENQREKFDIPADIRYLNCAYMSPQLLSVAEAGVRALNRKNQPWNYTVGDFFEPLRDLQKLFAGIIGSDEPERVAVTPSVSYGLANVARNLPARPGLNVVVAGEQFPSNVYTWTRWAEDCGSEVRIISNPQMKGEKESWNEKIHKAIDGNTVALAIGNVHWADGKVFDLVELRKKTNECGAMLIIDGTQSVGAKPFDVEALQADAVICAGYKWLMGPYSIGMAWYGPRFDDGIPIEQNWIHRNGSEDFKNLVNYQSQYREKAARYSVGESSNFILLPMMVEALKQIRDWGVENISKHCGEITGETFDELRECGCEVGDGGEISPHLFGIRLPEGFAPESLQEVFAREKIIVSLRGSAVRVSPHVYNTREDIFALLQCIKTTIRKKAGIGRISP